jgi:hypothetical protein
MPKPGELIEAGLLPYRTSHDSTRSLSPTRTRNFGRQSLDRESSKILVSDCTASCRHSLRRCKRNVVRVIRELVLLSEEALLPKGAGPFLLREYSGWPRIDARFSLTSDSTHARRT